MRCIIFAVKIKKKKININQQVDIATSYSGYCVKLLYLTMLISLENTDFVKLMTVMQWKDCLGSVECIIAIKNLPVMLLE